MRCSCILVKKLPLLFLAIVFCCFLGGCALPNQKTQQTVAYQITDITGHITKMSHKPQRILTLSATTDDVVLGLVKPEKLVAVNKILQDKASSNVYELARQVKRTIQNPSAEEIIALKPDLVIAPSWVAANKVKALRSAGLKVVVCRNPSNVPQIRENIQLISRAIGEPQRGQVLIEKMDKKLSSLEKKVAKIPKQDRKSVVLLSIMKTYGGIGSSFNTACRLADVINGRAQAQIKEGQEMTTEQLLKINPDYIFLPTYSDFGQYDTKKFCDQYLDNPALQSLKAIREKHVVFARDGYIYNNSQDFVFAVQEIDYRVYGDVFALPDNCHLTAVEEDEKKG